MTLDIIRKHNETGVKMTPAFRKFIRSGIDAGYIHTEVGDGEDGYRTYLFGLFDASYNKSKTRLWGDPETMADMVEMFGWHLEEEAEERRVAKELAAMSDEELATDLW